MDKALFFLKVWVWDAIIYPFRFVKNLKLKFQEKISHRKPVETDNIYICIHEWGGYPSVRQKHLKNIKTFSCGLDYQLSRFSKEKTRHILNLTITMSESNKYVNLSKIISRCDNFISVSNIGMDFSGYWNFYKSIKNRKNAYIILTNSSVNKEINPFIDDYIEYMENNSDVGILGISASSKYYHTLIRNNFNPHLQSFFLLTTISVLNEIVKCNNGQFPGVNETNKHLLIRNGEVLLSRLVVALGYKLAVVTENGEVIKFNYNSYPLKYGDLRIYAQYPNRINPIKKKC